MGREKEEAPWSLRQLGHVWYVRFRHAGRRHEYSTGQRDRPTAEVHAAIIFGKVATGEWLREERAPVAPAATTKTFGEVADMWTSGELALDYPDYVAAKKTADVDAARLRHICKTIGTVAIDAFTLEDAERAMRALPESAKTSTTRRHYAQLIHRVLGLACYPLRLRTSQPLPRGFLPKANKATAEQWLRPDEEARLVSSPAVPLSRRILWGFLAREGTRGPSEAAQLVWSNVDLARGIVTLDENKTDNPRAWTLDKSVVRALQRYKDEHHPNAEPTARVFVDECGEKLTTERGFAQVFRADLQAAGVDRAELFSRSKARNPIRAHDLRATFATVKLATGKSETWVMDRTGHTTSLMLSRYRRTARTAHELGQGDFVALDAALFGGPLGEVPGEVSRPVQPRPPRSARRAARKSRFFRRIRSRCTGGDLNPYASRRWNLNPLRLPFRHPCACDVRSLARVQRARAVLVPPEGGGMGCSRRSLLARNMR